MSKILNTITLLELAGDDRGSFVDIIDDFDTNGGMLLSQISQGVAEMNQSVVRMAAHQLKGSSGMLGMSELFELCKTLETLEVSQIGVEFLNKMEATFKLSVKEAKETLAI